MNLNTFRANSRDFGLSKATADLAFRAANHLFLLRILKGVRIEQVDPAFLECDAIYHGQFLTEEVLRAFAEDPMYELPHTFLDEALRKGDECYGFLAGSTLAAYGWYSRQMYDLDFPGLRLHFDDQYVYMYKGFTAAGHRGKRLHAIGMTRALEAYLARGYRGIVSYVEWNNFASLRSCYRMGYRDFGKITIAGFDGHYILHNDGGCKKVGFLVERIGSPREPWLTSRSLRDYDNAFSSSERTGT